MGTVLLIALLLPGADQAPCPPQAPPEQAYTYSEARAKAIADNKPLVVWVGEAICPGCIKKMEDQAIHVVKKDFPEVPEGGGIVVGVPEDGDLVRVATITQWTTGDARFGHVPSIRRAIAAWRSHRKTQRSGWSMGTDQQTSTQSWSMEAKGMRSAPAMPRSFRGSAGRG